MHWGKDKQQVRKTTNEQLERAKSCLMMLWSAKQISIKSSCKLQVSHQINTYMHMGRGRNVGSMKERKLWPSTPDAYCGNSRVHLRTIVNIFILVKRQEFCKYLPERRNRFCSHWFRIASACLGRTSFNQTKESSCFCGLSTFDLSAQIASEVFKLVLIKTTTSWWARSPTWGPQRSCSLIQTTGQTSKDTG